LRLDTRSVIVELLDSSRGESAGEKGRAEDPACLIHSSDNLDGWYPLRVRHGENHVFNGWWQHAQNLIRTVVALPPQEPPVLLAKATCVI